MKHLSTATTRALAAPLGLLAAAMMVALPAYAQKQHKYGINSPVSPEQNATAQQVASQGVPISALAPNAPDEYTVRAGDTLWGISGKFLKSPWRWPELWGMNLKDIHNPHLIYPGQQLYLVRIGDRAMLRMRGGGDGGAGGTIRVSPRTRMELLGSGPLPTLPAHLIEPFLTESMIVDDAETFAQAPRIVAMANRDRVLVANGDRAYVRGPEQMPLLKGGGLPTEFRVFRTATPLKDPISGEILGYEGQYVGKANLARGESDWDPTNDDPDDQIVQQPPAGDQQPAPPEEAQKVKRLPVPATIDVVSSKEEMRPGDRLLPEPPREFRSYAPHAPASPVEARVVKVHGNAVRYAGQNQIVIINKGLRDGIENGHVLAVLSTGPRMVDKTDGGGRERIKLPDERNGLALVFRPYERVSYALVMQITNPVQVGDKMVNPR